jgi:UDP-N-acetylmuramate--alanine ligase
MTFRETRIHFIGIGGIGMSGIARMLVSQGKTVSGSDLAGSPVTQSLASAGVLVAFPQSARNISDDVGLVVVSAAVKDDNPELAEARRRGITVQKYAKVLGRLMNERRGIAVSGTHGKTTTTAMIATVLIKAGLDPSFVVGAAVGPLGGSSRAGKGDLFVVEACEYDRSFHNLMPHCAVINNIEEDHLDYYGGGIEEIVESFAQFASQVRPDGLIVANGRDENVARATRRASCTVENFALEDGSADWCAQNLRLSQGLYRFETLYKGNSLGTFALGIPGRHNVSNALAAMACCRWAGVDLSVVREALPQFCGADRRFQIVGQASGVTVVDDYAHHPSEIRETLKAAREFFRARRIFVVFQPHQHSRTRFLLADFAASFGEADVVLVPDIYFVRDSDAERQQVNSSDLVLAMKAHRKECYYLATFADIAAYLEQKLTEHDVVITMGAGDIYKVGLSLMKVLDAREHGRRSVTF